MPKRRLASNEDNTSLRPVLHRSSRATSRKRISGVFTRLADACTKHSAYHQSTKLFARQEEDEENLPEKCRKDLFSVRALLPKVEQCFPLDQAKQCEASDVAHLCDFYDRVLRGAYCPHAPALFQWGKVPKDGTSRGHFVPLDRSLRFKCLTMPLHSSFSSKSIVSTCDMWIGCHQC